MFQTKLDQALHHDVVLNLTVEELREFCDFMEMRDDNQIVAVQFSLSVFGSAMTSEDRLDAQARAIFDADPTLIERRIQWIGELRNTTGCGLKEAKDSVDRVRAELAETNHWDDQ